jgi:hypothetical protein
MIATVTSSLVLVMNVMFLVPVAAYMFGKAPANPAGSTLELPLRGISMAMPKAQLTMLMLGKISLSYQDNP